MNDNNQEINTFFLPAEKSSLEEIKRQNKLILEIPMLEKFLNNTLSFNLILNKDRQAIFIDKNLQDFLKNNNLLYELGYRPGEIFNCIHSNETAGGCGTTKFCKACGAAKAIASALNKKEDIKECNIISKNPGKDFNFKVMATPFEYKNEDFILFSILDISDQKRKEALEKTFFHDVINTAGGLNGLMSLLEKDPSAERINKYIPLVINASKHLLNEILSQKELAQAERGELVINKETINVYPFLNDVVNLIKNNEISKNKILEINMNDFDIKIKSDKTFLSRILLNMIKNALEAEKENVKIKISCEKKDGKVIFSVKNPTPMEEDIKLQIFQRSFSTKGNGRGIGTYSIKLLTEKYLNGNVYLDVDETGTTFKISFSE